MVLALLFFQDASFSFPVGLHRLCENGSRANFLLCRVLSWPFRLLGFFMPPVRFSVAAHFVSIIAFFNASATAGLRGRNGPDHGQKSAIKFFMEGPPSNTTLRNPSFVFLSDFSHIPAPVPLWKWRH